MRESNDMSQHCQRFVLPLVTRREMLMTCANGFGAVALAALLGDSAFGADANSTTEKNPFAARKPHFDA